MAKASLIKDNIYLGLAYNSRGFVHYHHGGKHARMQTAGEGAEGFESTLLGHQKAAKAERRQGKAASRD